MLFYVIHYCQGVFGEGWTLEGLSILALSLCNTAGHPRVDEGSWPLTEQGWFVRYKCICLLFLDTKTTLVATLAHVMIIPDCGAYWVSLWFVTNCLFIPINQPTRCNSFASLLLDVYVRLNMFRASSRSSSGAQQLQ